MIVEFFNKKYTNSNVMLILNNSTFALRIFSNLKFLCSNVLREGLNKVAHDALRVTTCESQAL
jgi:hypothetical protein